MTGARPLQLVLLFAGVLLFAILLRTGAFWMRERIDRFFSGDAASNLIRFIPKRFDPRKYHRVDPAALTFVGLDHKNKPVYLTPTDRRTHAQVIGRTGSGKSVGVLTNFIYQDILNGHGVIVIDAKGSRKFLGEIVGMSTAAGRQGDLRILSLAEPDNSHSYNPFRIPPGASATQVADRFFVAISPRKEDVRNNYYLKQQAACLRLMVRALAGLGRPFTLRDLYLWIVDPEAFRDIRKLTSDQDACAHLESMQRALGSSYGETMSGLVERLQLFAAVDLLCDPNPSDGLRFDDVFEKGRIVYCQLPTGAEPLLVRDLARLIFQEIEFETSLREIGRYRSPDKFCAVYADEFYEFVYPDLISAIGKARSGNVGWTIAHQSRSDLARLGEPYWSGVWDNTAVKIILEQTDPDLGEYVARSLGTVERVEQTWRTTQIGWFRNKSGEESNRRVDQFRFNPNNLRILADIGQGFLINRGRFTPINLGSFSPPTGRITIPRSPPSKRAGLIAWAGLTDSQMKGRKP